MLGKLHDLHIRPKPTMAASSTRNTDFVHFSKRQSSSNWAKVPVGQGVGQCLCQSDGETSWSELSGLYPVFPLSNMYFRLHMEVLSERLLYLEILCKVYY